MEEDYELVPLGPIRRLEKKIESLEKSDSPETTKELVEIVKSNQHIVDEMFKRMNEMVESQKRKDEEVRRLTDRLTDFMSRLEIDSGVNVENSEPVNSNVPNMDSINSKISKLEKKMNTLILTTMPKKSFLRHK